MGTPLTNKYAEGYPGRRYYGGCEVIDEIEQLAIDRLKQIFGAEHANVQPHSGAQANFAAFMARGPAGREDHGHVAAARGAPLPRGGGQPQRRGLAGGPLRRRSGHRPDRLRRGAGAGSRPERPRLIIAGGSAYARIIDFAAFRSIADEVGAVFLVDMAHFAGLVAGGVYPSPVPHAPVVTSTTHKTLRGPRAGLILSHRRARQGDRQVGLPRHPGRAAGARHRGQGGGLRRGAHRRVQGLRPAGGGERPGAGRRR